MSDETDLKKRVELLERTIERERSARNRAEDLLENRSSALFQINQRLLTQYEAVAKKSAEIGFLHEVSKLVEDISELSQIYERFLEQVCSLMKWPVGHLYQAKPEGASVVLRSSGVWFCQEKEKFAAFMKMSERFEFKPNEGLPGRVYSTHRSHWIPSIEDDPNFPRKSALGDMELRSGFAVPIVQRGKVVAVSEFFSERASNQDESLMNVVETGAKQLGILIDRHETQRELKENFERLKQTQSQLVQSEKMASLGMIAAGVAHEINNPISFVLSNTETLGKYTAFMLRIIDAQDRLGKALKDKASAEVSSRVEAVEASKREEDLEFIKGDLSQLISESLEGINRVREIVQGLKAFSRVDEAESKEADVNECLETTIKVIWNELKYKCTLDKKLSPLPKILCYPGQLVQVFTNLLVNSGQAIETKGAISIRTEISDGMIRVLIADTGKGIKPEHMSELFTPFFTTKPVGKGTGLGLSISYGIIKKHGGDIRVQSDVGKGTTFEILLPVTGIQGGGCP